jgi:hypothetical protein
MEPRSRSGITSIMKDAMITAIHDEPKFSELFMAYLLTRNSRIEEDLIDQLFNSSERATCAAAFATCEFRQRRQPAADQSEHQSGNISRDDWHYPIPRHAFHEQVSQAGSHQLQRTYRGSQFAVECSFA